MEAGDIRGMLAIARKARENSCDTRKGVRR